MNRGYFLISDISGYTDFLSRSELDHASEIIASAIQNITSHIERPLQVSNYQGDAVLMYAPEEQVQLPQTLVHQIEAVYFAFRRHIENMRYNTSCECNACKNIPGLDLKFFIHYGEYTLQTLGDREELTGPDVILVHRLMKNKVVERTGLKAYAMFTEAAAARLPIDEVCGELIEHEDEIEDQGNVSTRLMCLHSRWEAALQNEDHRVVIAPGQRWVETQVQLSVPPQVAWNYITLPEHKKEWLGMAKVDHTPFRGNAYGNGSKYHCAHGEAGNFDYEVVDWRPFEYLTIEGMAPGNFSFRQMDVLEENEQGTLYKVKIVPRNSGRIHGFINNRRAKKIQAQYQAFYDMSHSGLRDYIRQQQAPCE